MQLRIENKLHPIVKNKLLDLTHLPAQPYLRQYNENDLLTEIEKPNPDWHEGDPEDERYIIEYVDEGYTGFLPVNLQIENPNFVQLWGKEDSEGEITFGSLPITENGKYKFWFNYEGFANGYIPVKRYDNNTEDYDYNINISYPKIIDVNCLYFKTYQGGNFGPLSLTKITNNIFTINISKNSDCVFLLMDGNGLNISFISNSEVNTSLNVNLQQGDVAYYYNSNIIPSNHSYCTANFYELNNNSNLLVNLRDLGLGDSGQSSYANWSSVNIDKQCISLPLN